MPEKTSNNAPVEGMYPTMRRVAAVRSLAGAAVVALLAAGLLAPALAAEGDIARLQRIPLDVEGVRRTRIRDFVVARDGTPWAVFEGEGNPVCHLDGAQWRVVCRADGKAQLQLSRRGEVFLMIPTSGDRTAEAYLLTRDGARHLTRVRNPKSTYFDAMGRIWNWSRDLVEKFEAGKWQSFPANFGEYRPHVLEGGQGNVYFVCFTPRAGIVHFYRYGNFGCTRDIPAYRTNGDYRRISVFPRRDGTAIVLGEQARNPAILDLRNLRLRQYALNNLNLLQWSVSSISGDAAGNVYIWVQGRTRATFRRSLCIKLDARTGKLEEIPLDWRRLCSGGYVACALSTGKGAFFLASNQQGLYRYEDGVVRQYPWDTNGERVQINRLVAGPNGEIWCVGWGHLFYLGPVLRPGPAVKPKPHLEVEKRHPSVETVKLVSTTILRDRKGCIWFFPADKGGCVSRFDGHGRQNFFFVPPNLALAYGLVVDEHNTVYLPNLELDRVPAWRIKADKVEKFANTKEMYRQAVAEGATSFRWVGGVIGPLVLQKQDFWICGEGRKIHRFNGRRWQELNCDATIIGLHALGGKPIFVGGDGRCYTFENGRVVEYKVARPGEYLLSENGLEALSEEAWKKRKGKVLPARWAHGLVWVFDNLEELHLQSTSAKPGYAATGSRNCQSFCLSPKGGYWSIMEDSRRNKCWIVRVWLGLRIEFRKDETPLKDARLENLLEDAAGNLWLIRRTSDPWEALAYVIPRPEVDTRIETRPGGKIKARKLTVELSGTQGGKPNDELLFTWRLNGGRWSRPSKERTAEIEILKTGKNVLEVVAVGKYAAIDTTPARLEFEAEFPVAVARITSKVPGVVYGWVLPVEWKAEGAREGTQVTYSWRLDGGEWRLSPSRSAILEGLKDGKHVFEVRAVEDGKWMQGDPTRLEFRVRIDRERFLGELLQMFRSRDLDKREAAVRACKAGGAECMPYLEKALEDAPPDVAWWIRAALDEIRRSGEGAGGYHE